MHEVSQENVNSCSGEKKHEMKMNWRHTVDRNSDSGLSKIREQYNHRYSNLFVSLLSSQLESFYGFSSGLHVLRFCLQPLVLLQPITRSFRSVHTRRHGNIRETPRLAIRCCRMPENALTLVGHFYNSLIKIDYTTYKK